MSHPIRPTCDISDGCLSQSASPKTPCTQRPREGVGFQQLIEDAPLKRVIVLGIHRSSSHDIGSDCRHSIGAELGEYLFIGVRPMLIHTSNRTAWSNASPPSNWDTPACWAIALSRPCHRHRPMGRQSRLCSIVTYLYQVLTNPSDLGASFHRKAHKALS